MSKRLSKNTANLLEKAKESALLAVDVYNKPKTSFRAGGFVVLMCIGWISLLHAIFEKNKVKYFYKKSNGRYERINGDKKAWELLRSSKEFYKDDQSPVYKNILFFSELRNKIEHRFMPVLDSLIAGECQALLLNFEELLVQEFGEKNSIIENLFIPLQLTKQKRAIPKTKQDTEVLKFITAFRNSLSNTIADSQKYSFKAFFIPKLGNHRNSSDVVIEFVKFNPDNPEEMKKYQKMLIGIKEKTVQVVNPGKYKPGVIYEMIKNKLSNTKIRKLETQGKFISWHTSMWKKHKVRPSAKSKNYKKCDTKYCQYDEPHKDYIYTDEWVGFLIQELQK
jgi:hypothetical protein